ncbi:MAG: DUF805 domain-containing protein [Veillonella sp.]|nr:DUF805 domain-containing protein [Veillonella sp.]
MYCPNCGSPLQPHQNFCGECGTQLLYSPPPPMNMPVTSLPFWDNFMLCITKKYFTFSGRASRGEYWKFQAVGFVIALALFVIGCIIALLVLASLDQRERPDAFMSFILMGTIVFSIYGFFLFIPSLALEVRRFHDAGYSAWWVLLGFIPYVGPFAVMIVCGVLETQPYPNEYGPIPDYTEELQRINEKKTASKNN